MGRSVRARGVALAAVAGLSLSLPLATSSSAALPQHAACSKLLNGVLSGCTPTALKAGATSAYKLPPPGTQAGTVKVVYTWKNGKGKTIALVTFKQQATRGKCTAGTQRIKAGGKVTGGSGVAATIIKKNEPFTASVCAITSGPNAGKTSLEPGTKLKM
jgi:hypothetical protein